MNIDDVVESKVIVFAEEYLRLMLLAQQEQANEHVDHVRMMPMHNVVVCRSLMLANCHRNVDVDVVVDCQDYVPMVKHRKSLDVEVLLQLEV